MKPSLRLRALRNVIANWFGLGATMIVGFFLTPFILSHLGDSAFGLWVILTTLTGYYGLFDLGLRNAVIRYVARYSASGQMDDLNEVVSTSLAAYSLIGVLLLAVTAIVGWQFDSLFRISAESRASAWWLLLIMGASTAAGMPLSVFAGVLEGLQAFTWVGSMQTVAVLIRAALVVFFLERGYGIVTVGIITAGTNLLASVIYIAVAFRLCPGLRFRRGLARFSTLTTLAGFALVTFWIGIAQALRFQAQTMIIAGLLSLQAVTFFSVSARLVSYVSDIVQAMAQVLTPMSSAFDATGEVGRLRSVLYLGNRYSAFVMFPLAAVLLILGPVILQVWLGSSYVSSYPVLAILTVPMTLYLAQAASPKVLYGMGHHRLLAIVLLAEGVANVALGAWLAPRYGIVGVAIGCAVPLTCTSLLFLPWHLCRLLGVSLRSFVFESYFYPTLVTLPLIAVLWATNQWLHPAGWFSLILTVCIGGAAYAAAMLFYFVFVERLAGLPFTRKAAFAGSQE